MTHKLNHTGNVAIDICRKYSKIDQNTPRGVKLILLTNERVAVFGVLTEANRMHFTHWEPLARIPDDEPLRIVINGELKFVKQYEAEK